MNPFEQQASESREAPAFPADRILWTDADYEKRHREMRSIPCIRGFESYKAIMDAFHKVSERHGSVFKESIQAFDPRQIFMRYEGKDWSYTFHEQRKEGATANETESIVPGIAKRIVKTIAKFVRETKREMDEASPAERAYLEEALVQKAENIFSEIYFPDQESRNVNVQKIEGPRGPVYFTIEGNHRLAAARLIDLKRVRGVVRELADPSLGSQVWFEMLALMPPAHAKELQAVYDSIYALTEK